MKKVIIGAAAAMAIAGVGQAAHAETTGVVNIAYNNFDSDSGSNIDVGSVGGAVVAPLSGAWTAQFDAGFSRLSASGGDETFGAGAAHATYTSGAWKLGGEVSVNDFGGEGVYGIGVDGQYNFSSVSLTGQVAYNSGDNGGGAIWSEIVDGKWFVTDNFAPDVHYAHTDADNNFFGSSNANVYGIGAEYKFDASPVSLYADYTHVDLSGSASDANIWTAGVRFAFGDGTLKERQDTGPSLITNALGFVL